MKDIFYKNKNTGCAWWPVTNINIDTISFNNEQIYKIYGQIFKFDSVPFRIAWNNILKENMWNKLNKKGP